MDPNELKAIIALLDDPDKEVVNMISDTLLKRGIEAVPELEKAWENTLDENLQDKLENIIQKIQFTTARENIIRWINTGAEYILEGAFFLAQYQYPDISLEKINQEIETIRKDIWLEINNNLTALEKIRILNYIIFDLHHYTRNASDFYAPQNCYLNKVIETKKGNPISLAIIYLSVAYKLGLPVYGVNLPKNFILAYKNEYRLHDAENEEEDILFYINPYNKGAVLGRREIDYFITQQQLKPQKTFYVPCSNRDIIIRLINNLVLSYEKLGAMEKITGLKELLTVVSE
ncbi:MAG: transglutaminase family protein [Bacteroidales bacterium]|nr:transglutaminase family protein [Bacteroidales bacterium]MBN2764578.1 transglutaminase family protein [Bacteroidales bacterium]